MLRASEACERAGFPTSSLVCEGFLTQAAATAVGLGMPNLPVALIPGHPGAPGDRLGTKKDVEDQIALQQHVSDVVKEQARAGKCWNPAETEREVE